MFTGQMNLQIPLGVTLPVAMSGSSTALPAQVGGQEVNPFAGVLSEIASRSATQQSIGAAAAKLSDSVTSTADVSMVATLSSELIPDSQFQPTVGSEEHVISVKPDDVVSEDESTTSQEVVQAEFLMPQNVALLAPGAPIVPLQQFAGRTPEQGLKEVTLQSDGVRATAMYTANSQTSQKPFLATSTENTGRTQLSEESVESTEHVAIKNAVSADIQPGSDRMFRTAAVTTDGSLHQPQTTVTSIVDPVGMLVAETHQVETVTSPRNTAGLQQAIAVPVKNDAPADLQPQSDRMFRTAAVTTEGPQRQPQTPVTPIVDPVGKLVAETPSAETVLRSAMTEAQQVETVTSPRNTAGLQQAIAGPVKNDVPADLQPRFEQLFRPAVVTTEGPLRQPQTVITPVVNPVESLVAETLSAEIALRSTMTELHQVETDTTPRNTAGLQQAIAGPVKNDVPADLQPRSDQPFRPAVVTTEGPLRQPQTVVTPVVNPVELLVAETLSAEIALRSTMTELHQVDTVTSPRSIVSREQALNVLVENTEQLDINETQVVERRNTLPQTESSNQKTAELTPLHSRNDANQLVDWVINSDLSTAKLEKNQMPVQPAGFRFSRSVDVEAALGGGQQTSPRVVEKTVAGSDSSMETNVEPQLVSVVGTGSNADFTEQGSQGFTQQSPEAFRVATQHLSGINQKSSVDTAPSAELSTLQAEPSHPEGRENIAGQVRERLSTHDIKAGSEQIVLRLSPEHLGDIKVNLRLENQTLKVEMVAENRMARESLLQHVDSLKEALSRQNISMDKFSVTSGSSDAGSQNSGAQNEWRELAKNRQAEQWRASGGYRMPAAETAPRQPMFLARAEHSMLDLHF